MGCGTSFVKYALFFFNLLAALFGLVLVGLGVAVLLKWSIILEELNKHGHFSIAPWFFIVLGAITFVIAFFGCCGAIRESHCMVVTYAIFLLVIIIAQVILAVLLFAYDTNIQKLFVNTINDIYDRRGSQNDGERRVAIEIFDQIQIQFECCGKQGPSDYGTLGLSLPQSCCTHEKTVGRLLGDTCTIADSNKDGCNTLYQKWNKTIAGIAIGIACVEVVGALFALCLANSIRNMDRRSRY